MARVMVVDDDFEACEVIAKQLREADHRVVTAHDAPTAMTLVRQIGDPDVYVVDVGLPGINGSEFVRRVTGERPSSIPTIFLAGRTLLDTERGRAPWASFLVKPFHASELLRTIQTVLDRKVASGGVIESGW